VRARWSKSDLKHGMWQIVVTEIPYQVQKSRLIEQVAELLADKKLPLLGDIRDESSDQLRIVLEPKGRTVDPDMLMASLFRATAFEQRFSMNMNVIDADRTPRLLGLKPMLRAWLDHRHEVLLRRSRHRGAAIARRLEILDGYLAVFLNLDELIRIIRTEDEPKPVLMTAFRLTEIQAEAILNMRLRSLRRLEEMELRAEHAKLTAEAASLAALLNDPSLRWSTIAAEIKTTRTRFGGGKIGARRTTIDGAAPLVEVAAEAFIEREAITVILSDKGWIRAVKGVGKPSPGKPTPGADSELRFKEGDRLKSLLACETTDRLTLFATNGRVYSLRPFGPDYPAGYRLASIDDSQLPVSQAWSDYIRHHLDPYDTGMMFV
jgi:topoisomerase-4 subunit A